MYLSFSFSTTDVWAKKEKGIIRKKTIYIFFSVKISTHIKLFHRYYMANKWGLNWD